MERELKLNELATALAEFEYPIGRDDVVEECEDVTLRLADGETNLGETVAKSDDELFRSAEELESEIMTLLPRHAVGEPYQSEGEG